MSADHDVLLGREDALAVLGDALAQAELEGGRAVVVAGEAGIGKTTLLEAFGEQARQHGAAVLVGHTASMDRAVPYAPIAQALRTLLRPLDDPGRRALLGPARDEIARLVPALGLGPPPGPEDGADDRRLRLHAALLEVLERAAKDGLVLLLEDVHWADAATLDLVSGLLSSLGDAPILLVASFRSDELRPTHPVRGTLVEWERHPRVTRLDLGRLADTTLHHLVAPLVGDDVEVARQAVERAGGNPFVALELARAGADGALPAGLRDAVLSRLGRLSQTAQDLVRTTAAGGMHVHHDLLAAVVDLRPSELRPALREAVDGHFLVADGDGYRFRHALMAEVLHDDLLPGERREVHGRYAARLQEVPDLMGAGRWTSLAEHLLAANDLGGAFAASLHAADECLAASALVDAADHFARAADLWPSAPAAAAEAGVGRGQLLLRAADAASDAAAPALALQYADRALPLLEEDQDAARVAHALRVRGGALYHLGRDGTMQAYEQALQRCPPEAPAERAIILLAMARAEALLGRYEQARPLAEQAVAAVREHCEPVDVAWAEQARASILANLDRGEEALAIFDDLADDPRFDGTRCHIDTNHGDALDLAGRLGDALAVTRRGIERLGGQIRGDRDAFLALNGAEFAWKLGRLEEAREWVTMASRPSDGVARLHRVLCVARLRLERDGPEAAASALATAARLGSEPHVGPQFAASVAMVRAQAALLEDDADRAWDLIRDGLRVGHESSGIHRYSGPLLHLGAEAAVRRRSTQDLTWVLAQIEQAEGDERGATPEWTAWSLLARAAATRLHDGPDGPDVAIGDVDAWRSAYDAAAGLGHRPMAWEAAGHLGEALLAAGRTEEAGEVLLAALAESEAAGARIATALRGVARRGRLVEADVEGDLTPREQEVLALLAAGRTNREIGDALFITHKTASTHVSNLLRKLGAANRTEAAAMASQRGLVAR